MDKSYDIPKKSPRIKFTYSEPEASLLKKTAKKNNLNQELSESIEEMRLIKQGVLPKRPY
jgi:hypothetical protein